MTMQSLFSKALLGESLSLEYGAALPERERSGRGYPVFGSNGVIGRNSNFLVAGPGIVVGRKGSVGEVRWSDEPFWPIDTAYYAVAKGDENLRWLYWLLANTDLKRLDAATGVPGLNRNDVYSLVIRKPPLSDQSRIAAVLDVADEAIAKTEAVIAKLRQVRTGVLHDLLTRGLDRNGELRDPVAHPEQFRQSPLGRIPRDWEIVPVESAGDVRLGRQRSPAHERGRYMRPYLRVANVFDGFIDYSDVLSMNFSPQEQVIYGLRHGDILLNEGQSLELVGRSAVFPGPDGIFCFQNTLIRFRCNESAIPEYCQAVFKYWLDTRRFTFVAKQTTSVAHLGSDRFAKMPFARPGLEEQNAIASVLRTYAALQHVEEGGLAKLYALKSGLTTDLLTGRIRVPERPEARQ